MTHAEPLTLLEDRTTRVHEVRVARLARAIARRLRMSAREIALIGRAAMLHDIGKIAVPMSLLHKPAGLIEDEREVMQRHVAAGFDLLCQAGAPIKVALIALQHHERLDGSGYPSGASGDAILFESRIVAVADVVDAITSRRAYKPALAHEAAIEELINGRAIRYDPIVVDACLAVLEERALIEGVIASEREVHARHQGARHERGAGRSESVAR